jgi:hypothetical protein
MDHGKFLLLRTFPPIQSIRYDHFYPEYKPKYRQPVRVFKYAEKFEKSMKSSKNGWM